MICNFFGWDFNEILEKNIEKLKARYPNGFTIEDAQRKMVDWGEKWGVNKNDYNKALLEGGFKWRSFCDFKGWNSEIAEKYYIYATPTMFLLDQNKKIIARLLSADELDYYIEKWIIFQIISVTKCGIL